MNSTIIKILLSVMLLTLAACGNSQQQPAIAPTTPTAPPRAPQTTNAPKTIDVSAAISQRVQNVSRSPVRQKSQISPDYPYDITLKTAAGEALNSKDVLATNGKPTVLLFWLTTCMPCRFEMKAIKEKFPQWQEEADFNFYAISTDFERNYSAFAKMVEENDWKWETYNDVNRDFRNVMPGELNGLPQTFVLDADGKIVYHKRKWRPGDEDVLFNKVKALAKG